MSNVTRTTLAMTSTGRCCLPGGVDDPLGRTQNTPTANVVIIRSMVSSYVSSLIVDVRLFQELFRGTYDERRECPIKRGLLFYRADWHNVPRQGAKFSALNKSRTLTEVNYFYTFGAPRPTTLLRSTG
jgi:hypothetical protein